MKAQKEENERRRQQNLEDAGKMDLKSLSDTIQEGVHPTEGGLREL
jgi:hypothetical protein